MTTSSPFPLEGGRAGVGGGGTASKVSGEDSSVSSAVNDVSFGQPTGRASTRTQPFPLKGEGLDRFARTPRIKTGGVTRARVLRANPTSAEAKLWKHLRRLEVRFRRQAPIGPYVVDFACQPARLVIEVDGGIHDLTDVALRDLKRDEGLASEGYRVIRIPNRRIETDLEAVVAEISKAAGVFVPPGSVRASTPSPPFPLEGKGSSEI